MKNKPEILAPAGSEESVTAAVRSGADAVYMGAKAFNARIKAENFSYEKLKWAIDYCHARNVRVHITMNTLIYDEEIPAALEQIKEICALGADAVIVQDLGVAALLKKTAPELERHASTQMSVQTLSGVKMLKNMGYSRVVLPRELSENEIAAIKNGSEIEIEIFVHGALCMCVSGQCYMSSMFGSRSGNRGLCAQPCRLPFGVQGGTGNDLSLKDLSLIPNMSEIVSLGIDSLKIEGRMKRPEYVSAAVTAVKTAIDGEVPEEMLSKLRAVFSRSGFTKGYFESKLGRAMFGIRQKEDVSAATTSVLKELASGYEKEKPVIPVEFYLSVIEREPVSLSASAMGKRVFVYSDYIPEKALTKPLTKENLTARISKCGGTQFYAESVEIDLDEGLIVPASVINNLRREALSELEKGIASVKVYNFTDIEVKVSHHTVKAPLKYHIRVANKAQIPHNLQNVENLYLPLNIDENTVENLKNLPITLGVEVPRGIFGRETDVEKLLLRAKAMGITVAYCGTLDAVAIAESCGFEIHTGFSMNITNSLSEQVLESRNVKVITLSPELTLQRCEKIGGSTKRGIIAYGRLPLMLTRNCPVKNAKTCDECGGKSYLTDRKNMKFPVVCSFGASEILNSQPIYMADRLDEIKGVDFITFYFTKESAEMCENVLEAYRRGRPAKEKTFTRGLYYRGAD